MSCFQPEGEPHNACPLDPASTSTKEQVKDHDDQDEVNATAAIVADSRTHVITAAAKEKNEDYQNDD